MGGTGFKNTFSHQEECPSGAKAHYICGLERHDSLDFAQDRFRRALPKNRFLKQVCCVDTLPRRSFFVPSLRDSGHYWGGLPGTHVPGYCLPPLRG